MLLHDQQTVPCFFVFTYYPGRVYLVDLYYILTVRRASQGRHPQCTSSCGAQARREITTAHISSHAIILLFVFIFVVFVSLSLSLFFSISYAHAHTRILAVITQS